MASTSDDCLVVVGSYTRFDNLAHRPHGTPAKHGMSVFTMNPNTGTMTLLHILQDPECNNAAFMRYHPHGNVLYAVTEDIHKENRLLTYGIHESTGRLQKLHSLGAGGKSTCYIHPSHDMRHLLLVNYWDSTLASVGINDVGLPKGIVSTTACGVHKTKPQQHGDNPHGKHRSKETHAHAIVLDPMHSRVAYVPDLGEDVIKQFVFDSDTGVLQAAGKFSPGIGPGPHGPRYLEFHPWLSIAYVVNELGSSVAVFEFDENAAATLQAGITDMPTLRHVQSIPTIPNAFPKTLNTCGRITVHNSGRYVLVSNRGHDSIVCYRVNTSSSSGIAGGLSIVSYYHTTGKTPRHFKFDSTGKWLLAANQDSDNIAVFAFNADNGELTYKRSYIVPSPNFILTRQSQHSSSAMRRARNAMLGDISRTAAPTEPADGTISSSKSKL